MRPALALLLSSSLACASAPPPPESPSLLPIRPLGPSAPIAIAPPAQEPEFIVGGALRTGDPVGQKAPGFQIPSVRDDGTVGIRRGRVTLVYFFATWCAPCAKALPEIEALYRPRRAAGFEVVAIDVDDERDGVREFVDQFKVTFPVGFDQEHAVAQSFAVKTMPSHYLVDRDGVIREVFDGYTDGTVATIETRLRGLL